MSNPNNPATFIFWTEANGKALVRCSDGKYRLFSDTKGYGSDTIKETLSLHSAGACKRMARRRQRCGWINTSVFSYERGDVQYIKRGKLPPS